MKPVDGADPRAVERWPADSVIVLAEQQEHRPGGRAGFTALTARRVEVVPTQAAWRRWRRSSRTTRRQTSTPTRRDGPKPCSVCARGRSHKPCADAVGEGGPIKAGDWIRDQPRRRVGGRKTAVDAAIGLVAGSPTTTASWSPCSSAPDAVTTDTARLEEHLALAHPQLEVEVHEGDRLCTVPRRRRVGVGRQDGLTLRSFAAHPVAELKAVGPSSRRRSPRWRSRTVLDLLSILGPARAVVIVGAG